jgi:BlaI family transcriptional regulator, penicillinase repressor
MPRSARDIPPPLELLCLRILWTLNEGNGRDVQRLVAQTRPLAYTTIMTVLDRLVRKGKLTRRRLGRTFVYVPSESPENLRRVAVRELLDGFFDNSEEKLIEYLRGNPQPAQIQPLTKIPSSETIDTILL